MYNNIGKKIKTLAKVLAWLGIAVSVIAGIAIIAGGGAMSSYGSSYNMGGSAAVAGITTIIFGALGSWVSSFMLYGFGELIEKTTEIAKNTEK